MLNPSTAALARAALADQIDLLNYNIKYTRQTLAWNADAYGFDSPEFKGVLLRRERYEDKRRRIQAAIKDLKACVWHGNPRHLPVGDVV
jgi:hypothetical protein